MLSQLLNSDHEDFKSMPVTAVVRKESQADTLKENGVEAVVLPDGLDDLNGLADLASQYDIVVQAAYGYHPASAEALIRGLARRQEETGRSTFYVQVSDTLWAIVGKIGMTCTDSERLQVSGTTSIAVSDISPTEVHGGPFSDKDDGIYEYEVKREKILPYVQRTLDVKVVEAGENHGVRTYLIVPPHVYGRGTGLFNRTSQLIPFISKNAIDSGKVKYILPGTSTYGYVHVEDLANLFIAVISRALEDPTLKAGRRGYFFTETGEYSWLELAEAIAQAGYELGAFSSPELTPVDLRNPGVKPWGVDDAMTERIFASS